jgi:phytoene dehydrogenase-like protein
MPDTLVIVGAGIAGLTAAWLAAEREPGARIVVVEQAGEPGGLLRSFDYGEFGRFDCRPPGGSCSSASSAIWPGSGFAAGCRATRTI